MSTNLRLDTSVAFVTFDCCNCGIVMAIPSDYEKRRRDDHKSFYCLNGHAQSFSGKSDAEKARDERDREVKKREWAEQEMRQARAEAEAEVARRVEVQRKLDKIKKRVGRGVCPCCSRSFANLRQHMETKHPSFREPLLLTDGKEKADAQG